jgi:hypothetical protein
MIEGVILATSQNAIPVAYRHGQKVPFPFTLSDQNENEITQDADLVVDRMWKPKRKFASRRSRLFDP